MSAQIGKIARAMPLDTTHAAKNSASGACSTTRLTQTDHYQALAKAALTGLQGQRVNLLIDRVLLRDHHNILVVSVGFQRRSLPVAWLALPHRGPVAWPISRPSCSRRWRCCRPVSAVTIHGDSEFRSQELFSWLRDLSHHGMLGVTGATLVALTPSSTPAALTTWLPHRASVAYLSGVYLTEGATVRSSAGMVGQRRRWQMDRARRDDGSAGHLADVSLGTAAHAD
ncbi:MAG: hypothetical protein IPP13_14825 [Kouleothrix sp.]|nr:hypothetical protein [Kouleothrix sp.]